jgi:hypothetical protein
MEKRARASQRNFVDLLSSLFIPYSFKIPRYGLLCFVTYKPHFKLLTGALGKMSFLCRFSTVTKMNIKSHLS